ncbi:MAG: redoxin domain-containing protein [Chitinophagaceae bacterium]|nr:MAG: redoxin domain-containing protein [Chitinophagaceae bacterium]
MKKIIFFIIGIVCASTSLYAQTTSEIKPLNIGDTLPDIVFNQIMNYPTKTAMLSDFENKKLIILDFWSTSCTVCIDYFPHMQSLSHQFKNDLQIILVDSQSKLWHDNPQKIERLLKNLKDGSGVNIQLPIVMNCEILDKYFPARTLPLEVWLSRNGVILAITGGEEVNAGNIRDLIEGRKVTMRMKKDVFFDIGRRPLSSLVYGVNSLSGHSISSSMLYKGEIDGLHSSFGLKRPDSITDTFYTGMFVTNMPLIYLYQLAYKNLNQFPPNRIMIETKDSTDFRFDGYNDSSWYSQVYSYDINVPPVTRQKLMEYMQHDLERTFHTKVTDQQMRMKCWVIKSTPYTAKSTTKGGETEYMMNKVDKPKYIRNFPMPELVKELNLNYFKIPVIDATGLKKNVDINMPDTLSPGNIIQALRSAGFEMQEIWRVMNVGVISDN